MTNLRIYALSTLFGILFVISSYFLFFNEEKKSWIIGGGEEGGLYDASVSAISKVLKNKNGWNVEVRRTSGSVENMKGLNEGSLDLCLLQNDLPGSEKIRSIATIYEEVLHIIVKDKNASLASLVGKNISTGKSGGGTYSLVSAIFPSLGIKEGSVTWKKESLKEGLSNLRQGKRKAVCIVTSIGNQMVASALAGGDLHLLEIGEGMSSAATRSYPFTQSSFIPQNSYPVSPGIAIPKAKITTVGTCVVLACHDELDESDTYKLASAIHEGRVSLTRQIPVLSTISHIGDNQKIQFPVHEGARKYLLRDEPNFLQNWAEPLALILSAIVIAWAVGVALREFLVQRRKDSLDVYFEQLGLLITELVDLKDSNRLQAIKIEIHKIRQETTQKLVAEQLLANESFIIFQNQLLTAQRMANDCTSFAEKKDSQSLES